jgi:hypothetical protein
MELTVSDRQFKKDMVRNWSVFYFQLLECIFQVLQTSADPHQQFEAPFKAAEYWQDSTCYIPFTVQHGNNWFLPERKSECA